MSGLKEVLTAFLDSADAQHPLLELLGESIARDHGLEVIEDPRPWLRQMLLLPLGRKVQMRRWWTHYDAGKDLNKIWHSMLLACMAWYYAEGSDPFAIATRTAEVHGTCEDNTSDNFQFCAQVLATLMNSMRQRMLRSTLVVCESMWSEHTHTHYKHARAQSKLFFSFSIPRIVSRSLSLTHSHISHALTHSHINSLVY